MDDKTLLLIVMLAYMVILIVYGIYQGRKVKTGADYAIAGRKLPGWAAALSERATGESSWALLGLPGAAYATGLTEIWTAIGCVFGILTAWILLAWRLRNEAEKYDVNTFTEYIAKRHGDKGNRLRIVGSFTIVFFFFFYVGAQFLGGGKTLNAMFDIAPWLGMLIHRPGNYSLYHLWRFPIGGLYRCYPSYCYDCYPDFGACFRVYLFVESSGFICHQYF